MIRIAINGFGRIGRNFLRAVLEDKNTQKKIKVVAINIGPARKEFVAHMFKYDTLLGIYPGSVSLQGDQLHIEDQVISIIAESDPVACPWESFAIDWVVESSGCFTRRAGAQKHIDAGAKKVLISAPAQDEDVTIIPGVNHVQYDAGQHAIVSLGSCTTNAFLPMMQVLHDAVTITKSFMTTIHSYTNTQVLLDVECGDLRRSRAAALNIIPTTTGAMKVMAKVMPDLVQRVKALAIRVPVAKVSLIDVTFIAGKTVSRDELNGLFETAAEGSLRNILGITHDPLVSSDFSHDDRSVIIDGALTDVCGQNMGKVFGWYDNEWGYSCRLRDFLAMI